jgi:hypothetical protein
MYASWTGTNWNLQTVDQEGCRGASLALDSHGNPHIAYEADLRSGGALSNTATLKFASLTGSNWGFQTVDSPVSYLDRVHLALDSHDKPHIIYGYDNPGVDENHGGPQTLKYAVLNGSSWNIQTAFTGLSQYGNLVLDSNDYPHFTVVKNSPQGASMWFNMSLTYASWNGSEWNTQTIDSNISSSDSGYLELDSHDNPSIDYRTINPNSDHDSLMYARWTGTKWDIQTVGPNSLVFEEAPIAVGSNGNPHITYVGFVPGYPINSAASCMYATTTIEPTPTPTPVATPMPTATPIPTIESLWIAVPIVSVAAAAALICLWKLGKLKLQRDDCCH